MSINKSNIVFNTKFSPDVILSRPKRFISDKSYIQNFIGKDNKTGYCISDTKNFLGDSSLLVHSLINKSVDEEIVENYIRNSIVTDVGPSGRSEYIFKQSIKNKPNSLDLNETISSSLILKRNCVNDISPNKLNEFFYSIWFRFSPNINNYLNCSYYLNKSITLFQIRSGGYNNNVDIGDYRVSLGIFKDNEGLYYKLSGDNFANGKGYIPEISEYNLTNPYWRQRTRSSNILFNTWYKLEVYIKKPDDFYDIKNAVVWCAITPGIKQQRIVIGHKIGGIQIGELNLPDTKFYLGNNSYYTDSPLSTEYTDLIIRDTLPMDSSERFNNNTMYDY